jgi:hypothetical protein
MDMDNSEPFLELVPTKGWLQQYVDFTMLSEAPAVFHFMAGVATIGTCVGRKAWFNKGYYKIYPNHQIILVAPTGKCRKTSALMLALKMMKLSEAGVNVIADKITPEALATALSTNQIDNSGKILAERDGEGLIFAPELAVFLGKQKYNEGLITLLTALFDNPDEWSTQTKGGGKILIKNCSITFMGASTPDWLITAIPQDAFGGGFMSRLLFVVQEDTPRCFPIPTVRDVPPALPNYLKLLRTQEVGEVKFEHKDDAEWYNLWYASNKGNVPEDEKMAGYHERKPDHLLRLAMVLGICEGRQTINLEHMKCAGRILKFLEDSMVGTFKWLGIRPVGSLTEKIVRQLRASGGSMTHAALLQKMIFYMDAWEFRKAIETLVQSNTITVHQGDQIQNTVYTIRAGTLPLGG